MAKFDELDARIAELELFRLKIEEESPNPATPVDVSSLEQLELRITELERLCKTLRK
jgi:hypothetical protein